MKGNLANGVGSQYSHTTSERGVSSITNADAHTSAARSRLIWRPRRFKWTRPFRRKTKSGFCACTITFQMHYKNAGAFSFGYSQSRNVSPHAPTPFQIPFELSALSTVVPCIHLQSSTESVQTSVSSDNHMMNFANENLDWLAQVREGLERSIKKCMDQAVPYKRQLVSYSVGARCAYRSRRRLPLL